MHNEYIEKKYSPIKQNKYCIMENAHGIFIANIDHHQSNGHVE